MSASFNSDLPYNICIVSNLTTMFILKLNGDKDNTKDNVYTENS